MPQLVAQPARLILLGAVAVAFVLALGSQGQFTVAGVNAAPSPMPSGRPPLIYRATGGPYLAETEVLGAAAALARGAVTRQEIHRISYGEVAAFLGNRNYEYDNSREMYLVASGGPWQGRGGPQSPGQLCGSYFAVYDATTGKPLAVGCGGPSAWPARLPAVFSKQ